eukprot:618676-Heterocapsa_arctica.AAC.1
MIAGETRANGREAKSPLQASRRTTTSGGVSQWAGPTCPRSAGISGNISPEATMSSWRFARHVESDTLPARSSEACAVATRECMRGIP